MNVNEFYNELLSSFGDDTGADNVNEFRAKLVVAVAAGAGGFTQGVAVANAAGANPTAAEFLALLTSLRNAGIIAT